MTRQEAYGYWLARHSLAVNYDDPHWDAEERASHRRWLDAMEQAMEALRRVVEFAKEYAVEAEPDSGWISVDDRLPEYNQKVFVVYNDVDPTGVSIRRLIIAELAVDGYWMEGCTWHPDTSITHWRPLPEPPKGE